MVSTILCVSRPQACISPWRTSSFPKQEESCPPSSTLVHPRPTFGTHAPPVYLFDQLLLSCRSADHVSCAVATPLIDEQHTTRHDRHRKQIDTVEKARAGDPPTARSQMPPLILNESRAIITQLCPSPQPPSLPFAPLRSTYHLTNVGTSQTSGTLAPGSSATPSNPKCRGAPGDPREGRRVIRASNRPTQLRRPGRPTKTLFPRI